MKSKHLKALPVQGACSLLSSVSANGWVSDRTPSLIPSGSGDSERRQARSEVTVRLVPAPVRGDPGAARGTLGRYFVHQSRSGRTPEEVGRGAARRQGAGAGVCWEGRGARRFDEN